MVIHIAAVNDQCASAGEKHGEGEFSRSSASWDAELQYKIMSSNTVKAFIQKYLWDKISCHCKINLNRKPISKLLTLVRILNRVMHILLGFFNPM